MKLKTFIDLSIFLVLFIASVMFLTMPVSADYETSGTIEYQLQDSLGYSLPGSGTTCGINESRIQHIFTDYKGINFIQLSGAFGYTGDPFSKTSAFTASVDGDYYGAGIVSITNVAGSGTYKVTFNTVDSVYANTLTGTHIIDLSISDMGIFTGLTDAKGVTQAGTQTSATKPTAFETNAVPPNNVVYGTYVSGYTTEYNHDYTYNYTTSLNKFLLDVDKLGFTSQLYIVNSTGGVYNQDSTYTDTNYSTYETYNNGVILSAKFNVLGGTYLNTTIQSAETPADPDNELDTSENDIIWQKNTYTIGDQMIYLWGIVDGTWGTFLYKFQTELLLDGVVIETNNIGQTGTGYYNTNDYGLYTINLQRALKLTTSWTTLDSADVYVNPEVDSYVITPITAYTRDDFEVKYLYGRTPIGAIMRIQKSLPDGMGGFKHVNYDWRALPADITAGIEYSLNLSIYESGTYLVGIYDIDLLSETNDVLIASNTVRVFYQDATPTVNITQSLINTNNVSFIGIGDTLTGTYQVDNVNYSSGPIRLEVYHYENEMISYSIPKEKQKSLYILPIKNLEYEVTVVDQVEKIYKIDSIFYTGNNQVRIARYDSDGTFNQTLAFTNVTIESENSAGYSLTVSKKSVLENEEFVISIKCPSTSHLTIWDDTGYAIDRINISGSTNLPYFFKNVGKYTIQLYDPSCNLQLSEVVTVSKTVKADVPIEDTTRSTIDMVITFLSMPAFWGMVIWVGVVGGAAQKVSGNSTGYIAFLFANILAVVGLFAPYTIYIVLITWIAAGIFFKLGRDAAGGE